MKGLNTFEKFIFFLNWVAAIILLFSYLLPFIPPSTFALLSVFSLAVPFLIIINFIFLLFWLLRLKKQMLLSLVVLILGFNHLTSIYEISSSEDPVAGVDKLKVLSYNVKQFNRYEWADDKLIPQKIAGFIANQDPDVVSIQEYFLGEKKVAGKFPHEYINIKEKSSEFGLAILSKFPIVNSGSLDFPTKSNNNAIFADIVKEDDTIRVINVHLQSFSEKPNFENLEKQHSKKVFLGMGQTFVRQERQMELVLDLIKKTPYPVLLMGDFNNTSYSYVYRELTSEGLYDAYKEAGNGLGQTFNFRFFPLRIDFIMAPESMEVLSFKNFKVPYSDHYPITATFRIN